MISLTLLLPLLAPAPQQEPVAVPAPQQQSKAQARYDALKAEYDKAYQAWAVEVRKIAAARESGEQAAEYPPQPAATFVPRFAAAAREYAGSEDAVPFLVWVVQYGQSVGREAVEPALRTLVEQHASSAKLEPLGPTLPYLSRSVGEDQAARLLARLEETTTSDKLRGWALFARLQPVFTEHGPDSQAFQQAKKQMLAALDKAGDARLRQAYDRDVTVLEVFGLGMTAPDIIGPDLDGVSFSLSDYKGKILFVDFWGDW